MSALTELLREAVRAGTFDEAAPLLGLDAVLDTSSERGRFKVRGREAIVEHVNGPGPGEVIDWDAEEWERGCAISFEWHGTARVDRRRWYLRREGDEITGWWSY